MNDLPFNPEYPGDTPNRAWVRHKIAEKGAYIDEIAIIKNLPQRHIDWMFEEIVQGDR